VGVSASVLAGGGHGGRLGWGRGGRGGREGEARALVEVVKRGAHSRAPMLGQGVRGVIAREGGRPPLSGARMSLNAAGRRRHSLSPDSGPTSGTSTVCSRTPRVGRHAYALHVRDGFHFYIILGPRPHLSLRVAQTPKAREKTTRAADCACNYEGPDLTAPQARRQVTQKFPRSHLRHRSTADPDPHLDATACSGSTTYVYRREDAT
jgi:hypothetical protein